MGNRKSCCFVSTSADQLKHCKKRVENQLDIPLALFSRARKWVRTTVKVSDVQGVFFPV